MYSTWRAELARIGMTLMELSDKSGIGYQTLSNQIRGRTKISLDHAQLIKAAMNVDMPIEELFAKGDA